MVVFEVVLQRLVDADKMVRYHSIVLLVTWCIIE
jgi:hypothetical protein